MLDRINHEGTGLIVNSRWLARLTEVENWRRHHRRRYDSFLIAQMRIWFEWFPNLVFVINYFANLHQNSRPYTNCNRPTRLYNVPKIFLTEIWTWIPNLLLSPEKKIQFHNNDHEFFFFRRKHFSKYHHRRFSVLLHVCDVKIIDWLPLNTVRYDWDDSFQHFGEKKFETISRVSTTQQIFERTWTKGLYGRRVTIFSFIWN